MPNLKTRAVFAAVVLACLVVAVALFAFSREPRVGVVTAEVTRGLVARPVLTTGTLQGARTVDVGTQVSGTILTLEADFNTRVKAGQIIARLDPATFDTEVTEALGAVAAAEAGVAELRVAADDAARKLERARELGASELITRADLDAADAAARQAESTVTAGLADLESRKAALARARVTRDHTIIRSPIDGVVINRNVAVGQTVAASYQAPVLFTIADLRRMELLAAIDEADVSGVQPGEPASLDIESLSAGEVEGRVSEVRLEPVLEQPGTGTGASAAATPVATSGAQPSTTSSRASSSSAGATASSGAATPATSAAAGSTGSTGSTGGGVVAYTAVIEVPNTGERLVPGATAVVTMVGAERRDVLRVPNQALVFQPPPEIVPPTPRPVSPGGLDRGSPAVVRARVWKYENRRFVPIEIEAGLADDHWTEVLRGELRAGDQVVTSASIHR